MKDTTREYFTKKRWAYDYMISQECIPTAEKGMPGEIYNLIREDFDPGYENDTQCPPCAFAIVKHGFYLFDQAVKDEKLIVHAAFPKQEPREYTVETGILQEISDAGRIAARIRDTPISEELAYAVNQYVENLATGKETADQRKARLADPNRIIKRRAKRK